MLVITHQAPVSRELFVRQDDESVTLRSQRVASPWFHSSTARMVSYACVTVRQAPTPPESH